ncbi:MAG: CcmD family protein [Candidatus Cyclobacteriaceae bacterium M3_2C_046]
MKKLLMIVLLLGSLNLLAQEKQSIEKSDYTNDEIEMADLMRSEGKIYVVVAVVVTILAGLILYLFITERKLKRLEKELEAQDYLKK